MKKKKRIAVCFAVYLMVVMGICTFDEQFEVEQGEEQAPVEIETEQSLTEPPVQEERFLAVREREYPVIENSLVYAAGQAGGYIVSEQMLLDEGDIISMLEAYEMPSLVRMSEEDSVQYMSDLQVLKRLEALEMEPELFFTPEYDWKTVYNDSLVKVKEALEFENEVDFEGNTASELNAFLEDCTQIIVNITGECIWLDETIMVPSDVILQGNGVQLTIVPPQDAAVQEDNILYAFLLENVEHAGIYGFKMTGGFQHGIYVIGSNQCLIWGNEISGALYKGICVMADNSYVNLIGNSILENGNGAIFMNGDISHCIIQGNEIYQNRGTRNLTAGIVFSSMEVEDVYTPYNEFKDEYLYNQLESPHQIVVKDNHIQRNYSSGIYCDGGYLNYIVNNTVEDNEKEGICLDYGTFGTYVTGNTIRRNGDRNRQTDEDLEADFILEAGRLEDGSSTAKLPGISIDNSAYNIIFENLVSDNSGSGIKIVRSGYRNLILCNIISDNNRGKNKLFHGFGIEFGHASDPDEPVIGLDFTADYENIAARNVICGAHYAGVHLAPGSYCNDLIDNIIMDSECYSVENHSEFYNSSIGNTANRNTLNYDLNK